MKKLPVAAAFLYMTPFAALAHPGHDAGTFLAGALHPVGGLDHILAMVAVGLWAAQAGGRPLWALPLAFVSAMIAGGALGAVGMPFAAVEPMILASIVILGSLVAIAARMPMRAALPLIAIFGVAHGWAHGAEGPATGLAAYAAGFAVITAALHGVGIGLGRVLGGGKLRVFGGAAAVAGLALAVVG